MKTIDLPSWGCAITNIDMGDIGTYTFVSRYNYSAACWTLDILDIDGNKLLTGLMLVPDVDILFPYPTIAELLGSLFLRESVAGDYLRADGLGTGAYLAWYPPTGTV